MQYVNTGEFLSDRLHVFEERVALRFRKREGLGEITYGHLRDLSRSVAAGLRRMGLSSGDRFTIIADSTADWVITFIAGHLRGAMDVSFDPALDRERIVEIMRRTHCRICFTDRVTLAEYLRSELPHLDVILLKWKKSESKVSGIHTLRDVHDRGKRLRFREAFGGNLGKRHPDDPASIMYKKKVAEGRLPRGIVLTNKNILTNIASLARAIPSTELDNVLTTLPLWHSSGRCSLFFALWNGAALSLSDPSNIRKDIYGFGPSIVMAHTWVLEKFRRRFLQGSYGDSPLRQVLRRAYLFFARMTAWAGAYYSGQLPEFRGRDPVSTALLNLYAPVSLIVSLPIKLAGDIMFGKALERTLGGNLRAVFTGGAPFAPGADFFFQAVGVSVLESYWMTEASHVISSRVLEFTGQRKRLLPGTVGPVLSGTELKLVNQRGEDVTHTPGKIGAIHIRGPQIMQGYFQDPETTERVLDKDGWLYTGDAGRLTLTGELKIVERWGRLG